LQLAPQNIRQQRRLISKVDDQTFEDQQSGDEKLNGNFISIRRVSLGFPMSLNVKIIKMGNCLTLISYCFFCSLL
jgi:hypothetical protein